MIARMLIFSLLSLVTLAIARAGTVTAMWDANPPEDKVSSYTLYWGPSSRNYTATASTTNTVISITNVPVGTNYFAVSAATAEGLISPLSTELIAVIRPGAPKNLRVPAQVTAHVDSGPTKSGPWRRETNFTYIVWGDPYRFWRTSLDTTSAAR